MRSRTWNGWIGLVASSVFLLALCRPSIGKDDHEILPKRSMDTQSVSEFGGRGALLLTRFRSLDELKAVVKVEYSGKAPVVDTVIPDDCSVTLVHLSAGREVSSKLRPGISEADFLAAKRGNIWDRVALALGSPFILVNRYNLVRIELLGRRRHNIFGAGDVAFYDLAETMVFHIHDDDIALMPTQDLSEKGYLNTFNHIAAQAFMTTLFSEKMADFIADVHERYYNPELITGIFDDEKLNDIEDGPVDNYLDIINNEWGQELGKTLRDKYQISNKTYWSPQLLADYLNDIQNYHSWAFQIGFEPFRPGDVVVRRFADKLNRVMNDMTMLKDYSQ